jgi:iron complex outermembrane receptor protein
VNAGSNSRHNESVYANFEAEVTRQFSASAALRHERYSDFGSTTSAKGSARYAFNDVVSLRATASSGFRAPSLAQQFYTITTTNFSVVNGVNTPIETGTFAVGSAAAAARRDAAEGRESPQLQPRRSAEAATGPPASTPTASTSMTASRCRPI